MAALAIDGIPDEVMDQLRELGNTEQRSLNQQVILLSWSGRWPSGPSRLSARSPFRKTHGEALLEPSDLDELRSSDTGRPVDP